MSDPLCKFFQIHKYEYVCGPTDHNQITIETEETDQP